MKTLVIFYSYTGHTKEIAQQLAAGKSYEIAEIRDVNRPGFIKAYTAGCFNAVRGKSWSIQPLGLELEDYERFILLTPVWAGHTPPAVHAVLEILPEGKTVAVTMVSSSGKSSCKKYVETVIQAKGGVLESFENIKA